jgi:hypothetical protein
MNSRIEVRGHSRTADRSGEKETQKHVMWVIALKSVNASVISTYHRCS